MTTKTKSAAEQPNAARPTKRDTRPRRPTVLTPAPSTTLGRETKRDQLASLLVRDEGATVEQMIAVTGWLPHTVRAALTGLKRLGYAIDSDKIDGLRTYRAVAPK